MSCYKANVPNSQVSSVSRYYYIACRQYSYKIASLLHRQHPSIIVTQSFLGEKKFTLHIIFHITQYRATSRAYIAPDRICSLFQQNSVTQSESQKTVVPLQLKPLLLQGDIQPNLPKYFQKASKSNINTQKTNCRQTTAERDLPCCSYPARSCQKT